MGIAETVAGGTISAARYRAAVRVLVNALPVRGTSLGVVTENLLQGWVGTDDLHVVLRPGIELELPGHVTVHPVGGPRLLAMERAVPELCRHLGADVMLGVTPATTIGPLPCPRVIISLDVRHEMRPHQFSTRTRVVRGVSYGLGYRRADAIVTISHRTREDLLRVHPWLRRQTITVAQLGADHVLRWPPAETGGADYALAFGQWGNKNVGLVLDAWARLRREGGDPPPLVVVGVPEVERGAVQADATTRGLREHVTVKPWLERDEFRRQFTGASLVVFPSDYEGFGLPALEAMRLGIPVVVTPDPALFEVTGGLATVMEGWGAAALARAVPVARAESDEDLARGVAHASGFTWARTASDVRATLAGCVDAAGSA
ncbi:MAG TPA: glycosyltransferase [Acidimicrobiales bacterium]|jgi:glycosyltransferase involved in cell wall biosynthesis|nr:glycosyltransferase [Acidimicrobiales bacterium]